MTYLELVFAKTLQNSLKMAIYDRFSSIKVAILVVPMHPCAWEDEEHDHIKLSTWAFCEKIISRKNFEKKVFVMAQTQGKWLEIMLKITWKFWKKWIFFDFSKWLLIIIYHRSSVPKCPPDFRESFSSHIDTPINFGEKTFDFKMIYLKLVFAEALQNSSKIAIYDWFFRVQVAILGVPMRPCAGEDKEHEHINVFTWVFCEKIISRKFFFYKVFIMAQTQGKWLKTMLKIAWKCWKKSIFFSISQNVF